jgi:hypothetical protein
MTIYRSIELQIGVGKRFPSPLPPNPASGSPARGSPIDGFCIEIGTLRSGLALERPFLMRRMGRNTVADASDKLRLLLPALTFVSDLRTAGWHYRS